MHILEHSIHEQENELITTSVAHTAIPLMQGQHYQFTRENISKLVYHICANKENFLYEDEMTKRNHGVLTLPCQRKRREVDTECFGFFVSTT